MRIRINLRLAAYRKSLHLGAKLLEEHDQRFFFPQLNPYGHSPHVTSSLTRGWVCRLLLLLGLASAVIFRSDSGGTHHHILLSQTRYSPNLEGQVPVFISLRNKVAQLYPQVLGSFSLSPTARRATVKVFDPASTRECTHTIYSN
jgi:hypothetical protein